MRKVKIPIVRFSFQSLANAKAGGVWGNHDFGLCVGESLELRQSYGDVVVDYM